MATKIQICNLALARVGSKAFIENLEDASTEAALLKLHYELVRDLVLRAGDWPFCRARAALAQTPSTPPPEWLYAYAYPEDCLAARWLEATDSTSAPRSDKRVFFELQTQDGGIRILTSQPAAVLRYTRRVENEALYPPDFVNAFAWLLAAEVAAPLTGKPELEGWARKRYERTLTAALAAAYVEQELTRETFDDPDFLAGR